MMRFRSPHTIGAGSATAFPTPGVSAGLAAYTVEPDAGPLNAVELVGVVTGIFSSPYPTVDAARANSVPLAGRLVSGIMASAVASRSGKRSVTSSGGMVSPT